MLICDIISPVELSKTTRAVRLAQPKQGRAEELRKGKKKATTHKSSEFEVWPWSEIFIPL